MFEDMIGSDLTWYEILLLIAVCIIGFIIILPIMIVVFVWCGIKKAFSWSVKKLRDWAFDPEWQHTF